MQSLSGRILRVGVTGGIGSGKSLVCSYLSSAGIAVLSADAVAKDLMLEDPRLKKGLIRLLGSEAFGTAGGLNRQYVAKRIFSNSTIRKKVDALVHPRVEEELRRKFGELEREGHAIVVVEAALIFESGLDDDLDYVIVVDAPEDVRLKRITERDDLTLEEAQKRMKSQWSAERKVQKASYVIRNDGSKDALQAASLFVATVLQTMAKEA